jgi:hypothetical protein
MSYPSFAFNRKDSLPSGTASASTLSVYTIQNMSFGAFHPGNNGGTISISSTGDRTVTNDVVALNLGVSYFQAMFEIEAPEGTIISILNGPAVTLNGSNGGTMSLQLGAASPASPFNISIAPPGRTQLSVGGTLTVGNATSTPAGSYSGTFTITFNQE